MIDFGPIDELREIRRRLVEQCGNDIERYAAMLAEVSTRIPGHYVTLPIPPKTVEAPFGRETDTDAKLPSGPSLPVPNPAGA